MKISKLFHWLYAIVMLLPIFAIGITCGYAMFNKNAYRSYNGDSINKYSYVDYTDIELEKNYKFESNKHVYFGSTNLDFYVNDVDNFYFSNTSVMNNILSQLDNINHIRLSNYANQFSVCRFYYTENDFYTADLNDVNVLNFSYDLLSYNGNIQYFYEYTKKIEYDNLSFVSEVFYYSVDKVTQSNIFNWAYDSFLVAPFSYIVNLFSMPTNSPVVMLLSYWLSMSIIWLTFDLVMYVPLLVHRWLDKGVLE